MKKFMIKLLYFLPLLLLVAGFNFIVDPWSQFKNDEDVKKMVDALLSGTAATNLKNDNFDCRVEQKLMIQSLKHKIDIGVFGSSRVATISSEMFPGKILLNTELSANSLQDDVILYEMYREKGILPSNIIIGIDPWIFNKNTDHYTWKEFGQYYARFNNWGPGDLFDLKTWQENLIPYKYQLLVNHFYTLTSIQYLLHPCAHNLFSATDQRYNEKMTYLPDGSWTWDRQSRESSVLDVRKIVEEDNFHPYNITGFSKLDEDYKQEFVKLIKTMKNDGVRVILFLPPYHPMAYDWFVHSRNFRIIEDVEIYVRKIAKIYGLTLVGSYNPHLMSIPESSFFDSVHLRDDKELIKIFSPLNLSSTKQAR